MKKWFNWFTVLLSLYFFNALIYASNWQNYSFDKDQFSISLPNDWEQIPENVVQDYIKKNA